MVDEHLRELQLSGVDLVVRHTGSIKFKLIVFVQEGEAKSASLMCFFIYQLTLTELSEYY